MIVATFEARWVYIVDLLDYKPVKQDYTSDLQAKRLVIEVTNVEWPGNTWGMLARKQGLRDCTWERKATWQATWVNSGARWLVQQESSLDYLVKTGARQARMKEKLAKMQVMQEKSWAMQARSLVKPVKTWGWWRPS